MVSLAHSDVRMAGPLTPEMLNAMHACWRASNLSVGQINPRDNPLVEQAHARTHQAALARASTAEARGTLRASGMRVIMTTGDA